MDRPLNGGFICAKHNIGYKIQCPSCLFISQKEKELRQLLHNTVDVMTFEQLQKVAELLNLGSELNE
ncbi:hypothetical protein [Paenibacillus ihuae]|uniref:hypothetical protein n=1 Tax=Paenibacillus ihuae TaxID=1232431 RepID=UPI0006D53FD1|nr:hypothetical protein [Paenibacillus ihuae]